MFTCPRFLTEKLRHRLFNHLPLSWEQRSSRAAAALWVPEARCPLTPHLWAGSGILLCLQAGSWVGGWGLGSLRSGPRDFCFPDSLFPHRQLPAI